MPFYSRPRPDQVSLISLVIFCVILLTNEQKLQIKTKSSHASCICTFQGCACVCKTFESANVQGLLQRQMKWPAWGDGRSSEGGRGGENRRNKVSFPATPGEFCSYALVKCWSWNLWGGGSDQSHTVCGDGEDDPFPGKLKIHLTQNSRQSFA